MRAVPKQKTTVAVRMRNLGFGDSHLVTVSQGRAVWRMLVDCGVHSQGQARPISESVDEIIADLSQAAPEGKPPHLDVLVATHHHADHISGFALDAWEAVDVGQVWVPFVEDASDPGANALRTAHSAAANQLLGLIQAAAGDTDRAGWSASLAGANAFAVNCLGNADATDRLLGRNGRHFANVPEVKFLPHRDSAQNVIDTGLPEVTVHVLGPPCDPAELRRMDPPPSLAWLQLDADQYQQDDHAQPLFNSEFHLTTDQARAQVPELFKARNSLRLTQLSDSDEALLAAAAVLENAVNNTSVFFVLDVAGTRLLFPGDAQQGAWDHVLDNDGARGLITGLSFYKISHHGSHNGTPRRFVEQVLGDGVYAMLPWGLVKRWKDTIPSAALLKALADRDTHVIRADAPVAEPRVKVQGTSWSEVTFTVG